MLRCSQCEYVDELEQENRKYRNALEKIVAAGVEFQTFGRLENRGIHYTTEANIALEVLEEVK